MTTDYCAQCGGPCALDHCDHCGIECDPERIYVRNAGSLPHFPGHAEDGYYHLCAECAEEYGCNRYAARTPAELWDAIVGVGCSPEDLLTRESSGWPSSIDECIDSHLDRVPWTDDPTEDERDTLARALGRYAARSLEESVPEGWYLVGSDDLAYVGVEAALRLTPTECADLMVAAAEVHGVMRWHRAEHRIVVARKLWGVRWIVRR